MIKFVALILALSIVGVVAQEHRGGHAQLDQKTQEWFGRQKIPGTQKSCCTMADGTYAEEDMRDGRYWTRFTAADKVWGWMIVPEEAVIHDPNRNGAPAVWYSFQDGSVEIRCYAPGGGV